MEFTTTEKGARKLLKDGFIYFFQKTLANDVSSWECSLRRKGQCKARVKLTSDDQFIEQTNEHTHPPSETNCEMARVKAEIKRRAETSNDTSRQILAGELGGVTETTIVNLQPMETLRRNIRAARQERNTPTQPLNREAIPVIPQHYCETEDEQNFLIFDSGVADPDRILIFSSEQQLQFLSISDHWFADGTFKVCPKVFFQVYTIHAEQGGKIFPCVFALLPNKTEVRYTRFYQEIFNRTDGDGPEDILIDFERSALNALNNVKPQVGKKGCFYHFCANVWKHIQNFGLQHLYNMNQEFAINLRMLCALIFIPPPEVTNGFDTVCGLIRNNFRDEADDELDYFEDTYVGRFRHNAPRRNPRFSIEFWNMFNRTDQELPRTNNSVEG